MKKKFITTSIVLLFIEVAIAPSITVNVIKASTENELIEVTTEACGLPEAKPQTVKLTKQQYNEVENLFDSIKQRLDNSSTKEETIAIFNDAVVSLNGYGLLPKGMSIEEAQQLVICDNHNTKAPKLFQNAINRNFGNNDENFDCQIVGRTDCTGFYEGHPVLSGYWEWANNFIDWIQSLQNEYLYYTVAFLLCLLAVPFVILLTLVYITGIQRQGIITFGWELIEEFSGEPISYPAEGWVWTQGSNGVVEWNNSFYGRLGRFGLFYDFNGFIGATGFTGIKITRGVYFPHHGIFLGSASHVALCPNHP